MFHVIPVYITSVLFIAEYFYSITESVRWLKIKMILNYKKNVTNEIKSLEKE